MRTFDEFQLNHDPMSINERGLAKTCIVSAELVGLFKNGGLGTSMTGIAELLAGYGGDVTVIYTGQITDDTDSWVAKYAQAGIRLQILGDLQPPAGCGPLFEINWGAAWQVYHVLKSDSFDVIHFNDTHGTGAYCFLAKQFGLAFQDTLLTLAVHSPMEWILESNCDAPTSHWISACIAGERISFALTDLLWGPSSYLLNWLKEKEYSLPDSIYRQQYVIPDRELFSPGTKKFANRQLRPISESIAQVQEIVFFGRLEERKGIRIFTAAISILQRELSEKGVSVLYMGKRSGIDGEPVGEFIEKRAANWECNWRIEDSFGQQEAIGYLKEGGRLAVMASPVDNSPCTVYEALMNGFPFIAANTGGIPELIDPRFHESHLFDYRVKDLCSKLQNALNSGLGVPEPSVSIAENQARWLGFHSNWRSYLPPSKRISPPKETWGVFIDHEGDSEALRKTMKSISDLAWNDEILTAILDREQRGFECSKFDGAVIYDELRDDNAPKIVEMFMVSGVTKLLCVRSGIELSPQTLEELNTALVGPVDALMPVIYLFENDKSIPVLPGCPTLACLESHVDEGVLAVDLRAPNIQDLVQRLDRIRVHLGFRDELIAADCRLWPYPESLAQLPSAGALKMGSGGAAKHIGAYSTARDRDVYQILSVAQSRPKRFIPEEFGQEKNRLKTYILSNPPLVRKIFGNRIAKKFSYLLYKLCHLPPAT